MTVPNSDLILSNGNRIEIADQLGNPGGEGTTYRVKGAPKLAAKIYHTPPPKASIEKLEWMIAHPPPGASIGQGNVLLAWPQSLVNERTSGQVVGFTMPLIEQSWEFSRIFAPELRKRLRTAHGEEFGWHHLHEISINLARIVEGCHATGYVIGDLNHNNTRVSKNGQISLIDTDSFQVSVTSRGRTRIHHSNVVFLDYTPPELFGKDLSKLDRAPSTDCFILAELIFKLLQDEAHPFHGASSDPQFHDPVVLIAKGYFPYNTKGINQLVQPNPDAPPYGRLHPDLRALFQRTFVDGHSRPHLRPAASEWSAALFTARRALKRCARGHYYSDHNGASFCMTKVTIHGGGYCGSTATHQRDKPIPIADVNALTGELFAAPAKPRPQPQPGPSPSPRQTIQQQPTWTPPPPPPAPTPSPPPALRGPTFFDHLRGRIGALFRPVPLLFVLAAMLALALVPTGYGSRLLDEARTLRNGSAPGQTTSGQSAQPGSNARQVAGDAAVLLERSTRSGLLLFSSYANNAWAMNLFDPDSGETAPLLQNLKIDPAPAWSRDGSSIAFVVQVSDGVELRLLDRTSHKIARLATVSGTVVVSRIAWTGDDARMLLSISDGNGPRIIAIDAASGRMSAFLPVSSHNIAVSSGGDTAYSVFQRGDFDLVIADGKGDACCYGASSTANEIDPTFSPNGAWIAYDESSVQGEHRVAIVASDGVNRMTVPDPSQGVSAISTTPVWSPDGGTIAFVACVPDRCRILATSLNDSARTSAPRILLSTAKYDQITSLSWSGNGGSIQPST